MQQNGINCWWVSFVSPQFGHYSSPTIMGLQYVILPILDKPNMGFLGGCILVCDLVVHLVFCQRLSSMLTL
jgi:hypothetical protein